jgi:hypothetical protein
VERLQEQERGPDPETRAPTTTIGDPYFQAGAGSGEYRSRRPVLNYETNQYGAGSAPRGASTTLP